MRGEVSLNPLHLMGSWVSEWEKLTNELCTQWLNSPGAARTMRAWADLALRLEAGRSETTAKMLAAANMPSRADVATLGRRLSAIEASLAKIEACLEPPDARPRRTVRRTRAPGD